MEESVQGRSETALSVKKFMSGGPKTGKIDRELLLDLGLRRSGGDHLEQLLKDASHARAKYCLEVLEMKLAQEPTSEKDVSSSCVCWRKKKDGRRTGASVEDPQPWLWPACPRRRES